MILASFVAGACTSKPTPPPPDPQVAAAASAFHAALGARDLQKMQSHFADRVQVVGDLDIIGKPGRGSEEVSAAELAAAYAKLFDRLTPQGWTDKLAGRRALLNVAEHDGHHADYAKAGDWIYELGRPGSQKIDPILVFLFRKIGDQPRIVAIGWDN